MNPMTNVKNIQKLNQLELQLGGNAKTSWHQQYKDSAWIFVGGLPYDLTEGDVLAVFSQYGEIVNINLVRDKATGKSKGFAFLCFEDQRSTILTVDNLNSLKILGRTLRVDHCENYRRPKETGEEDDRTQQLRAVGCAPKTPSASEEEDEEESFTPVKKSKKEKKKKVKKEKKKKKEKGIKVESDDDSNVHQQKKMKVSHDGAEPIRVKQEKIDPRYDKYATDTSSARVNLKRSHEIKQERDDERDTKFRARDFDPRSRDQYDKTRDDERREKGRNGESSEAYRGARDQERRRIVREEDRRDRARGDGQDRLHEDLHHASSRDRKGGNSDRGGDRHERDRHRDREAERESGRNRDSVRYRENDRDRTYDRESDRGRDRDYDRRRKHDR